MDLVEVRLQAPLRFDNESGYWTGDPDTAILEKALSESTLPADVQIVRVESGVALRGRRSAVDKAARILEAKGLEKAGTVRPSSHQGMTEITMIKRSVLGLAVLSAVASASAADVPVYVEGQPLSTLGIEAPGTGRLLIPMRAIFTALGAKVEWDAKERAVYAWKPDRTGVRLGVGKAAAQTMTFSENPSPGAWGTTTGEVKLDVPAIEQGGRVFVPLRFVAETFGQPVRYVESGPYVAIGTVQPNILTEAPVYCGSFTVFVVRGPGCGQRASRAIDVINDYLGGRVGKVTLQPVGKNIRILLNGTLVVECTPTDAVKEKLPSVKSLAENWSRSLFSAFDQTKAQI